MNRHLLAALTVLASAAQICFAQAQQIQWLRDAREGVSIAKQNNRPIMFYVIGSKEDRPDDTDEHRRAFQDPTVLKLSRHFVPVRIARAQNRELVREWGLGDSALDLVFTTPDGKRIDTLSSGGIARASSLANKMFLVFDKFRNEHYDAELKPVLEKADAPPAEVKKAVQAVDDLVITRADAALLALLEREKLEPALRKITLDTLAKLSTAPAVQSLLKLAPSDKAAADALAACTPVAAEQTILPVLLNSGNDDEKLLAYKAVTTICKVRDPKPDKFWSGKNEAVKTAELDRVQKLVRKTAEDWKRKNEYR